MEYQTIARNAKPLNDKEASAPLFEKLAKKAVPLHQIIKHGDLKLTPPLAERVIAECHFEAQDARTPSMAHNVALYAEAMRRGYWYDYSQISFCQLPDNTLILVNGYTRMNAVVAYGHSIMVNVIVHKVASMKDVAMVYAQYDRATFHRVRSEAQLLNSIEFSESLGLSRQISEAVYRSIPIICNGMRYVKKDDRENILALGILEHRATEAAKWAAPAKVLDRCFTGGYQTGGHVLKRRMLNATVFSVALVTAKYQPEKAEQFWFSVAKNDGLRVGSAEHALVQALLTRPQKGLTDENFQVPALAWNAFFKGRGLTHIKSGQAGDLVILGTPIRRSAA